MDRLFVPLKTGPFEWFESGEKRFELRRYGRRWTDKHVYPGREVELRKGYSGKSIWGSIGKVIVGDLDKIFFEVDFKLINPTVPTVEDIIKRTLDLLGPSDKYIAFEVK